MARPPLTRSQDFTGKGVTPEQRRIGAAERVKYGGLAGLAAPAPGGEEVGPRDHLGVISDQRPPLAFGQAAPDAELHMVVERVGEALGDDGTTPANDSRPLLRR